MRNKYKPKPQTFLYVQKKKILLNFHPTLLRMPDITEKG